MTLSDNDRQQVWQQVRRCMDHLVGGSGHLVSYYLDQGSFEILEEESLAGGLRRFVFRVQGERVSEFAHAVEEDGEGGEVDPWLGGAERERLEGSLVLDAALQIALDGEGQVRLSPWRALDPTLWLGPR